MKKIAVVGSINMDITCKTERFPKAGETIFGDNLQYVPGGKGNNQAVAAARLGGDVTMFANFLDADSVVILSGILDNRLAEVEAALQKAGLTILSRRAMEEWRCICAKRS